MKPIKEPKTLGDVLNCIHKHFDAIPLGEGARSKVYSVASFAYEDVFGISVPKKDLVVEIVVEGPFITSAVLIKKGFFRSRHHSLIMDSRFLNSGTTGFDKKMETIARVCRKKVGGPN